jgi:hypothetical protein
MGALQLTYEPKFKIVHRTGELMRSHEAKSVQLWLSIDPLAEKFPHQSPYVFTDNNPINKIDPDGRAAVSVNPPANGISQYYDNDGRFFWNSNLNKYEQYTVGKDGSQSFKGYYTAGSDSKPNGTSTYVFNDNSNSPDFVITPDRPDYDGKLTLSEANNWYRSGNGEPLLVNAGKIDLSPVETGDFKKVGASFYKNFFLSTNQETGAVYGTIKLTLDSKNGNVTLGNNGFLDEYNFEQKENNSLGRIIRNIGTKAGGVLAGDGTPYNINVYGTAKVEETK